MSDYSPYLSKTLYIKGYQCHKALWLKKYHPELADEISTEQQVLFDSGTDMGFLAQQLFPDGLLISYDGHSMPCVDIGPHCEDAYTCEFSGHCWQHLPAPSVFDFARIGKKAFELYYQGIHKLEDAPASSLNAKQRLQQEAWVEKKEHLVPHKLKDFVDSLQYPLCFMDFETFATPVPHFDNTRPYCQVPFQFSLHIQDNASAGLVHREFLADGKSDPQQSFLECLLADIPASGSIVVWNQAFEKGRLQELQKLFPRKWQPLQNMLDRVVDLMVPFRDHDFYHWQFNGSYSIKKVLPVLAPELSYDSLVIQNGSMAPAEWLRMIRLDDQGERQVIREQLLAYCGLDTLAMARILEEVRKKSTNIS